jgi:nicotinamidase-related amidase
MESPGSNSEKDTLNVLLVVDVQDCFMSNLLNNTNILNLGSTGNDDTELKLLSEKLNLSSEMVKQIVELDKKSNITIFTRDMHPINHISFEGDEGRTLNPAKGYWPHHCRTSKTCDPRLNYNDEELKDKDGNIREPDNTNAQTIETIFNKKGIKELFEEQFKDYNITDEYKKLPIKGNQLSYFFYFTQLADKVKQLNALEKPNVISLIEKENVKPEIQNLEPEYDQLNYKNIKPIDGKYYSLWKGERCNYESYSAFNYHLKYEKTYDENIEKSRWIWDGAQHPIAIEKEKNFDTTKGEYRYSTGLFEFIIDYLEKNKDKNIGTVNFNICGLVGDVCVMHTAIQGSLLYENIYKDKFPGVNCNFNVELSATAFLGPSGFKKTFQGYYKDVPDNYIANEISGSGKEAALQEYKKFYEDDTKVYYENKPGIIPPTYKFIEPPIKSSAAGGKRTRKNRKKSIQKIHKSACKCKFCLFGGGKRKSTKKRRQTKRKRYMK